jgi:hypothetical protein
MLKSSSNTAMALLAALALAAPTAKMGTEWNTLVAASSAPSASSASSGAASSVAASSVFLWNTTLVPLQSEQVLVFPAPDAPQKGGANANGSVPLRRLSEDYWDATGAGGKSREKTRDTVGAEQSRRDAALRNATGFLNLVLRRQTKGSKMQGK